VHVLAAHRHSSSCRLHQRDDLHQIVGSEERSTRGYDDERIVGNDVRPLCRNGLEAATAVREVHPIFVPTLAAIEEDEPLTVQRMKRVRDLHPPLIVVITCS
jgi:hypothetical protein